MAQSYHPEELKVLRERQEALLKDNGERGDRFTKVRDEYLKLKETLVTLPDEVSRPAMVPIVGKLAFMPGRLVRTNEVMVLLGDDWFAVRSAKQAAEIADRRIAR